MPHVAMSVQMLASTAVVDVDDADPRADHLAGPPGPVRALDRVVEPDLSTPRRSSPLRSSPAVVSRSPPGPRARPRRATLRDLLAAMGAEVSRLRRADRERHRHGVGLDADLHDVGDSTPSSPPWRAPSRRRRRACAASHLRGHETDRLDALAREINALGGDVEPQADSP